MEDIPHARPLKEFPDRKECHLLRLSIPDLILGLILDLPECAEQCSRCSLSLFVTFLACFEIVQKWSPKWTFLRSKIAARPHLEASRTTWGYHFCASELKLNNLSKMCRNGGVVLVVWRPGARPWSLHRISMVSPSNLHRISMVSPSNLHRGNIDSAATRTPTYILDA